MSKDSVKLKDRSEEEKWLFLSKKVAELCTEFFQKIIINFLNPQSIWGEDFNNTCEQIKKIGEHTAYRKIFENIKDWVQLNATQVLSNENPTNKDISDMDIFKAFWEINKQLREIKGHIRTYWYEASLLEKIKNFYVTFWEILWINIDIDLPELNHLNIDNILLEKGEFRVIIIDDNKEYIRLFNKENKNRNMVWIIDSDILNTEIRWTISWIIIDLWLSVPFNWLIDELLRRGIISHKTSIRISSWHEEDYIEENVKLLKEKWFENVDGRNKLDTNEEEAFNEMKWIFSNSNSSNPSNERCIELQELLSEDPEISLFIHDFYSFCCQGNNKKIQMIQSFKHDIIGLAHSIQKKKQSSQEWQVELSEAIDWVRRLIVKYYKIPEVESVFNEFLESNLYKWHKSMLDRLLIRGKALCSDEPKKAPFMKSIIDRLMDLSDENDKENTINIECDISECKFLQKNPIWEIILWSLIKNFWKAIISSDEKQWEILCYWKESNWLDIISIEWNGGLNLMKILSSAKKVSADLSVDSSINKNLEEWGLGLLSINISEILELCFQEKVSWFHELGIHSSTGMWLWTIRNILIESWWVVLPYLSKTFQWSLALKIIVPHKNDEDSKTKVNEIERKYYESINSSNDADRKSA